MYEHGDTLYTKQVYLLRVMSSMIILTVIKTVHHLWILLITQNKCSYHVKMYVGETQSHSTHTIIIIMRYGITP